MHNNNNKKNELKINFRSQGKDIFRLAFFSMLSLILLVSIGCSSGDDFVLTHQGQFLDAPVRGLDYVCGGESGVTDEHGMFTFERGKDITFRLGNIQLGETVPVVSGLKDGEYLPDVWVFTPRMLFPIKDSQPVQYAKNRDPIVANILRFLQTLDDDYSLSDDIDNAANGIYLSDTVRKNAANFKGTVDFSLSEAEFEKTAETVISTLTGQYRRLIPKLSAQHHFMVQLIKNEVDDVLNHYGSPGVTMSVETPCPCEPSDTACIQSGVVDGVVSYDSVSHSYIWDFAAGYADVETKKPMTIDTRFRICSLTKSFVAMTILKLVDEDKVIDYKDLVKDHLPADLIDTFNNAFDIHSPIGGDSPTYANKMTIAQVMNHSAGIPNFYIIPAPDMELQEGDGKWFLDILFHPEQQQDVSKLVERELKKGPDFYPGESWEYSNTGYSLLGLMLKEVTGKPWEQLVREKIIEPYGLTDTIIPETGKASISESISNPAYYSPYDPNPTNDYAYGYLNLVGVTEGMYGKEIVGMTKRDIQDPSFMNSAGSMISTAPNLRSWIKLIATNTDSKSGNALLGADFDGWLNRDNTRYKELFSPMIENVVNVGANIYHSIPGKRYIMSGNSTGYDVNATYDIPSDISVGACANRTFEAPESSDSVPDIWKFNGDNTIQIKDALVFNTIDILTR